MMKVTDADTGKPFFLDMTSALNEELEGFFGAACGQVRTDVRTKLDRGGAEHFVRQCIDCGVSVGSALRKSEFSEHPPSWDINLEPSYTSERNLKKSGIIQKHVRKQRAGEEGFKRKYNDYLSSPEWALRRAKVLKRANGICEGCLERQATQVHHLTYSNVRNEFMFELVAVCVDCHQRLHPNEFDEASTVEGYEDEWRDGFLCDACRYQDQKDSRRWCGKLNQYATDALGEQGECGPTGKELEALK